MLKNSKILVTGYAGLIGSAIVRRLRADGYTNLVTVPRSTVDLTDPVATEWMFSVHQPEFVFHAAARVGGVLDNDTHRVEFYVQNVHIQNNVLLNAQKYGVKKLVFLGSSCIYPKDCPQPIREEYLLTGPFSDNTAAYGLAKVGGVRLCQWMHREFGSNFISAMPCNVFGVNDNFDPHSSHVIPGMLARMHQAKVRGDKTFKIWGDGTAKREFVFSDDLAEALVLVMKCYDDPTTAINTGSGFELSIAQLATCIARVVGHDGDLQFDSTQLTGVQRKVMDNSKLFALGWTPKIDFFEGLRATYRWFLANTTLQ